VDCKKFDFTRHAIEQMFSRIISAEDVKAAVNLGKIIASYPHDRPYPSYLMLYNINQRPLHVVIAVNKSSKTCTIITAYEPSSEIWDIDFKTRKK